MLGLEYYFHNSRQACLCFFSCRTKCLLFSRTEKYPYLTPAPVCFPVPPEEQRSHSFMLPPPCLLSFPAHGIRPKNLIYSLIFAPHLLANFKTRLPKFSFNILVTLLAKGSSCKNCTLGKHLRLPPHPQANIHC